MQSTADVSDFKRQGNVSSWSLDEMDWALLQKMGTINPSLNMNLNELILGILVLMYVLNEVIIQGIKVMALGKCSKTQWLRRMGLKHQHGFRSCAISALEQHRDRAARGCAEHPLSTGVNAAEAQTVCKALPLTLPAPAPGLGGFMLKMPLCRALHGAVSPPLRYLPS